MVLKDIYVHPADFVCVYQKVPKMQDVCLWLNQVHLSQFINFSKLGTASFGLETENEDTAQGFYWEASVERFHVWQQVGTLADSILFFELRQSGTEDFSPGRRKPWLLTPDDCLLAFYLPLLKQRDNLPQMTPYCWWQRGLLSSFHVSDERDRELVFQPLGSKGEYHYASSSP